MLYIEEDSKNVASFLDNRRILVVDDDTEVSRLIVSFLKTAQSSVLVFEARTGDEARKILGERDLDAVILDLGLQGESGLDILSDIRRNESTQDLTVIVVTGFTNPFVEIGALDAGASDYMTKPVTQVKLLSRLVCSLKQSERIRGLQEELERYKIASRSGTLSGSCAPPDQAGPDDEADSKSMSLADLIYLDLNGFSSLPIEPDAFARLVEGFRSLNRGILEMFIQQLGETRQDAIRLHDVENLLKELDV